MTNLDEPRVYKMAKDKLIYSIMAIILVTFGLFLDVKRFDLGYLIVLGLIAIFLFFPFTYKLLISNEAISSINLFRIKTLEWNEISEIQFKSGGILLKNSDDSIKVLVKSQVDGFPEIVKLIQHKRSHVWNSQSITEFHQGILENLLILIFGLTLAVLVLRTFFIDGLSKDDAVLILGTIVMVSFAIWFGVSKIRKISIDDDSLIVKYLLWNRKYHSSEIISVSLEQKMEKNLVKYPVYIYLESGKKIVLEKVKEGNPVLLSSLEQWLGVHKKATSQISNNAENF